MDLTQTTYTVLSSAGGSLIAMVAGFYWMRGRKNSFRRKLEKLSDEEDYLEGLSRGNIKLIRLSVFTASAASTFFGVGISVLFGTQAYKSIGDPLLYFAYLFAFVTSGVATGLFLMLARDLTKIKNMKATKAALAARRDKIEDKLGE